MRFLKKRVLRSALALATAGSLAGAVLVAQGAGAQTTAFSTITVNGAFSGPVPTGVTGLLVQVACRGLAGIADQTEVLTQYASFGGTAGGSIALSFPLAAATTTANSGSSCRFTALPLGTTANLLAGGATITVGGTVRTVTSSVLVPSTVAAPNANTNTANALVFATDFVPVNRSTTVAVTWTYPSLRVTKVVNGDEPTAGFAYPFTIACSNTNAVPAGYSAGQLVVPNNGFVQVGAVRYNDKAVVSGLSAADLAALIAEINRLALPGVFIAGLVTPVAPVGAAGGFTGTFTLTGTAPGNTRLFGLNEFPFLAPTSQCEVRETNSLGSVLAYSSTNGNLPGTTTPAPALPGVLLGTNFQSALTTANGQTVTVTNSFFGELYISKVVTGDPKTNIGIYEISVACDKGGPKETFSLKDRQTKVYSNIAAGTNCLVTETRSDGAVASYTDNSGDNTTDGRVTIRTRTTGAAVPSLNGGATAVDPNTVASVIVTNSYVPPTTTSTSVAPTVAPVTAAPATAAPAPTAAPAVQAAPAAEVESEPTFTG